MDTTNHAIFDNISHVDSVEQLYSDRDVDLKSSQQTFEAACPHTQSRHFQVSDNAKLDIFYWPKPKSTGLGHRTGANFQD